ncbi:MAG: S1C family serine protease [Blautia sp.]
MSEEFKDEFRRNDTGSVGNCEPEISEAQKKETDVEKTAESIITEASETVHAEAAASVEVSGKKEEQGEPGVAPTPENPVYARSYRKNPEKESSKEEWYQKEQQYNYSSYRFTPPVSPDKHNNDKKKKGSLGVKLATAAATAAVFGLVAGVVFQATNYVGDKIYLKENVQIENTETTNKETDSDTTSIAAPSGISTAGSVSQVAKNAMPSVVSIVGVSIQEIPQIYRYFGYGTEQQTQSSGSGIIVGQNETELLIATNNHVVSGTDSLTVCFTNQDGSALTSSEDIEKTSTEGQEDEIQQNALDAQGSAVSAQIKGTDADNDLAVIAVKLEDIPEDILSGIKIATIGDSDSLQMGDQVVAIGNALGYGQSVTSGYVSALNRHVSSDNADSTFIQTDAAINPGNSGGALLNMNGELIGINSAKIASGEVEGVGFAIPISKAEPILDQMMSQETRYKVEDEDKEAYIGITCENVTSEVNQMYGIPVGVYVDTAVSNGPADQAGIQKGDVITKIDGTSVNSYKELVERLQYYEAGETIDFEIYRAEGGEYKAQTVSVTLGAKKDADTSGSGSQKNEKSDR